MDKYLGLETDIVTHYFGLCLDMSTYYDHYKIDLECFIWLMDFLAVWLSALEVIMEIKLNITT
jgi:hypothetical protein